jgi:hypothetical protein
MLGEDRGAGADAVWRYQADDRDRFHAWQSSLLFAFMFVS